MRAKGRASAVSVVLPSLVRASARLELALTAGRVVQVTDIELHLSTELLDFTDNGLSARDHDHHHQPIAGAYTLTLGVAQQLVVELPGHEHLLDGATALETFTMGQACDLARLDGNPEAALPFMTLADRVLTVSAKVDGKLVILGRGEVQVLPPLAGPLLRVGRLSPEELSRKLIASGALFAFAVRGAAQWFVWFGDARGNVVGEAELRAAVSVRDDGVSRTFTNKNLPAFGVYPAQPGEKEQTRPGGFAAARAWTEELVAAAPALDGFMPRIISNTWFTLTNVRFTADEAVAVPEAPRAASAGLWSRLAVGAHIHVQLGDHDALDDYTFRIDSLDGGLKLHWQMGKSDQGDLFYSTPAIETARTFTVMSQGNVDLDQRDDPTRVAWSMPPFMLSRHLIRELRQGEAVVEVDSDDQTLSVVGRGERTIEIEGDTIRVQTLQLSAKGIDLEVVDDEALPLVLTRRSWGEEVVTFVRVAR